MNANPQVHKTQRKRSGIKGECLVVFYFALLLVSAMNSCKKTDEPLLLSDVNRWILDSMRTYYYWTDKLVSRPVDQGNPQDFFSSILYSADRFSFLENFGEVKEEYSAFAWYGMEYAFLENPSIGVVTLVVPDGPADRVGIKRGDYFKAVNGIPVNVANQKEISTILKRGNGASLTIATQNATVFTNEREVQINHYVFTEQPIYKSKIFQFSGKKIGYIFYNQFNGNYDQQLLQVIGDFKRQAVQEIIFDLRYNPGGDVSSVAKITAALSRVSSDDPFVIYQANKRGGRRIKSFQKTINENNYYPQSFSEILANRLDVNRVFVLTTRNTTSAAELLINNLKPYTKVLVIGETTQGKDMASFAIEDLSNPRKTNVVLHPLVFKLYNASGKGDYSNGLNPDYSVNEFSDLPLRAFGDENDPLLRKALELIAGNRTLSARKQTSSADVPVQPKNVAYETRDAMAIRAEKGVWGEGE